MPPKFVKRKNTKKIKRNLEEVEAKLIPEQKLKRTIELLNDPEHDVWDNEVRCCMQPIHQLEEYEQRQHVEQAFKMQLAQKFLLRRDWSSLGKVLALSNPTGTRSSASLYPLCVKYATICLAHNNKDLLDSYIKSLYPAESSQSIINKCTRYSDQEDKSNH